jgi:hypothetical protein
MVADVHRILLKGGVFMYPPTKEGAERQAAPDVRSEPDGDADRAGRRQGAGGAGQRILEVQPTDIHQRTPRDPRQPGRSRPRGASNRQSGDLRVREYNTQELYREIALPQDVDPARAQVDVEHGVATIKIARGAAKAPIANAPAASTPTTPKIEAKKPEPAKPAAAAAPTAPSKPLPSKAPIAPSKPTPAGKPAPVTAPTAPTAPTAKKPEAPAPKSNKSTSKPKPKSYGANG